MLFLLILFVSEFQAKEIFKSKQRAMLEINSDISSLKVSNIVSNMEINPSKSCSSSIEEKYTFFSNTPLAFPFNHSFTIIKSGLEEVQEMYAVSADVEISSFTYSVNFQSKYNLLKLNIEIKKWLNTPLNNSFTLALTYTMRDTLFTRDKLFFKPSPFSSLTWFYYNQDDAPSGKINFNLKIIDLHPDDVEMIQRFGIRVKGEEQFTKKNIEYSLKNISMALEISKTKPKAVFFIDISLPMQVSHFFIEVENL